MDRGAGTERTSLRSGTVAAGGTGVGGSTVIADVAYSPVSTASSSPVHNQRASHADKNAPASSVALMDVRYVPTK